MNQRERLIAIVAVAAVGLLALDHFALSPLLARREKAQSLGEQSQISLQDAQRTLASSRRATKQWNAMGGASLKQDASEAESQMLHSVRDWAQESGLTLSAIKPERSDKEHGYQKITLQATGTGGMDQVSRFLYRIQSAAIPMHLVDFQLSSRKDNTDDLAVQLKLATIYLLPQIDRKETKP